MHLRALALFKEIYWSGSITAGAARCHVSQPSASRMLRHLESQLGYALFERQEGRIRPTAEAQILIQEVDQIFLRVQQTEAVARRLARGSGDRMAVTCVHTMAEALLPRAMRRLHAEFPELELHLDAKGQTEQLNAIARRSADIGVATGLMPPPGLESRIFGRSRFVAVMPSSHPLAARPVVTLEDYGSHPCLLGAGHDPLGGLILEHFARAGVAPQVRMRIGSPLLCYETVRAFGYLTIAGLMTTATLAGRPDVVIRRLEPEIGFSVYAIWRAGDPPSAARNRILDILAEEISPVLTARPETLPARSS
jgi:DNA-binding transcriptional LysR family regulator